MKSLILRQHALNLYKLMPDKFPTWNRKVIMKLYPLPPPPSGVSINWCLLGKEEAVVLKGMASEVSSTLFKTALPSSTRIYPGSA